MHTSARIVSPLAGLCALFVVSALQAAPVLPDFSAAVFLPGEAIDHPYFPLIDTSTKVYLGQTEEDGEVVIKRSELTTLGPGPVILGVQVTTSRDRAFENGLLIEDTFDYFAQDTTGNVWYMGEDVTNYVYDDEGNLIDTNSSSSWRAGVNGALPGFIMPANLDVGFNYYQEFAGQDQALDQGTVFGILSELTIGLMTYHDVLRVIETTELDPDVREAKYYAPGIGLIFGEEGLDENLSNPSETYALVVAVPEPSALVLLAVSLAGIATRRARVVRVASKILGSRETAASGGAGARLPFTRSRGCSPGSPSRRM
ncbi:MAG: PEP-CTERM sorting domain-containing protein [Burkholderiales bacterium]|nr:PEP-CTERM sorting domain-containing protein [Burkholderiales bacterium]